MIGNTIGRLTRRGLIGGGAALLGVGALPTGASAQAARFRRWEISDPAMPTRVLKTTRPASPRCLQPAAQRPRNRACNAMVHVLDCPHGNWWFLAWHRAYLGWLEATVRELERRRRVRPAVLGLDARRRRVPAAMFADAPWIPTTALSSPTSRGDSRPKFEAERSRQLLRLRCRRPQMAQLTPSARWRCKTTAHVAGRLLPSSRSSTGRAQRGLTATNPDLDAEHQGDGCQERTIRERAADRSCSAGSGSAADPAGFQSAKAADDSGRQPARASWKAGPHDNVHGAMGGGGGAFMRRVPTRRWIRSSSCTTATSTGCGTVWSRRLAALGQVRCCRRAPISPPGGPIEPVPVLQRPPGSSRPAQAKAGDYATTTGPFDYNDDLAGLRRRPGAASQAR